MKTFIETYIDPPDEPHGPTKKRVRIAVLDTGFRVDEQDRFLKQRIERVTMKKNFVDTGGSDLDEDCTDTDGHGTHVVRLLLRFARRADIVVAKISRCKTMEGVTMDSLAKVIYTIGT